MKHNYSEIIELSLSSRKSAYAPYSKFKVGAAVLTKTGKIFAGANIESASFSLTICAERVAYSKAVTEGERNIVAIAIASNRRDYLFPCGACRQFMSEFGEETDVLIVKSKKEFKLYKLKQLLPEVFSFK